MANCMPDAMERYEASRAWGVRQERQRDFLPLPTHLAEEVQRASLEAARTARFARQTPEHYVEDMTVTQEEEEDGEPRHGTG